mgnify:CR=1 FL=1
MKPIAWYDPSNGAISTDKDSPFFTPLGQVWGLYPEGEWVGLTDEEIQQMGFSNYIKVVRETEAKLKQKNSNE